MVVLMSASIANYTAPRKRPAPAEANAADML